MKPRLIRPILCMAFGISLIILLFPVCRQSTTEVQSKNTERFKSIVDEYWNHKKVSNPLRDLLEGKNVKDLPDISIEKYKKDAAFSESILEKLLEVNSEELSHKDWINHEILEWQLENEITAPKYYWFTFLIPPVSGYITYINRAYTEFQFKTQDDLKNYLTLLEQYPGFIRTVHRHTQEQLNTGIILPKEMYTMVNPFLSYILAKAEDNLLYVKDDRLSGIEETEAKSFQKTVKNLIDNEVYPVLKKYVDFIKGDYYKQTPDAVGLWQYSDCRDYYNYLVKVNTTLDLTPEEIHELGLSEVAKIKR